MNCCCSHSQSAGRFFSFFARRYRRRFEKKGFEPSQKQLLAGLEQAGYSGATVLEIGSGVGHLHQTLLEKGAASAVGIDLSPKMNEEARQWAEERGLGERTRYFDDDFMILADELEVADVTILDKVVCCYPDAEGLVKQSLKKTQRVYALTYPHNRWYIRFVMSVSALLMLLIGSDFRPYVHDPILIEQWIIDNGYTKNYEASSFIWLTQVYIKQ
jgi:magnesium-protoporphyrin O-methyltransferase